MLLADQPLRSTLRHPSPDPSLSIVPSIIYIILLDRQLYPMSITHSTTFEPEARALVREEAEGSGLRDVIQRDTGEEEGLIVGVATADHQFPHQGDTMSWWWMSHVAVLTLGVGVGALLGVALSIHLLMTNDSDARQQLPVASTWTDRSQSLADLYSFSQSPPFPNPTFPSPPFPPSFPFPVDVNSARLSTVFSLLRAGVGIVVGVVGGSVSAGHGIPGETIEQRQQLMYAAKLVEWLNRYYPVRHPSTYRYLSRHVLWNAARPATDSRWSSYCLESQFLELQRAERFAVEGNSEYVRQNQTEKRKGQTSSSVPACPLDLLSPQEVTFHMPDLLLVEFAANDFDVDAPSTLPLNLREELLSRSDADEDPLATLDSLLSASQDHGDGMGQGWVTASMERLVRGVLGHAEYTTAVLILAHCSSYKGSEVAWSFYSAQERHAAVARWYGVPLVSVRDRLWWDRISIVSQLGVELEHGYEWWLLGRDVNVRTSVNTSLLQLWDRIDTNLYVDRIHLKAEGHFILSLLLMDELKLFTRRHRDAISYQGQLSGLFPTYLPLPNLNLTEAAQVFHNNRQPSRVLPLPSLLFLKNERIVELTRGASHVTCARPYQPYEPKLGSEGMQHLNLTSPLPPGWAIETSEGKVGYAFTCSDEIAGAGCGQSSVASTLTLYFDSSLQYSLALLFRVSGTKPQGVAALQAACIASDGVKFLSSPIIFNATVSFPATVFQLTPLHLSPSPALAPCRYEELYISLVDNKPFMIQGYFAI